MSELFMLLLFIFAGVALMVVLGERFGTPVDPERSAKLQRWLIPLIGVSLVLSVVSHYLM